MSLQKAILKQYMELSGNPTLKVISEETGVQITRVFRLFNGSVMKLNEYLIFQDLVRKKLGFDLALEGLILECRNKLSIEGIKEVEAMIRRKIHYTDLLVSNESLYEAPKLLS
jgi:hypothetical protein